MARSSRLPQTCWRWHANEFMECAELVLLQRSTYSDTPLRWASFSSSFNLQAPVDGGGKFSSESY
eukprot:2946398-Amphidinium_carterae.2